MDATVEKCPECDDSTIVALTEPEAKPVRFNARATRCWRIVNITNGPNGNVATPIDVHEPHSLTCKAVNRT